MADALTFHEAMRLKNALELAPGQVGIMVALIESEQVDKSALVRALRDAASNTQGRETTDASLRSTLHKMRQRLPKGVALHCTRSVRDLKVVENYYFDTADRERLRAMARPAGLRAIA